MSAVIVVVFNETVCSVQVRRQYITCYTNDLNWDFCHCAALSLCMGDMQECFGFEPWLGLFYAVCIFSLWLHGFTSGTPFISGSASSHSPKTYMLDSKMALGVNGSLSQCLFLCVTPALDWCSVCGLPHFLPCNRCDRLLPPKTLN